MRKLGIIILIIGFVVTIFTATIFFTKVKVVKIGSVEITKNKLHFFHWSPLMGIAIMGIGIGIFLIPFYKKVK